MRDCAVAVDSAVSLLHTASPHIIAPPILTTYLVDILGIEGARYIF